MAAISLTAGNYAGFVSGYARTGNGASIPAIGSISEEPIAGLTLMLLSTDLTGGSPALSTISFEGNQDPNLLTNIVVDGQSWAVAPGEYDNTQDETFYRLSPTAPFADSTVYSVDFGAGAGGDEGGGGSGALSIVSSAVVLETSDNASTYTSTSDFTVAGGPGHILVIVVQVWKNFNANVANSVVTVGGAPATNIITTGNNPYASGIIAVVENPTAGAKQISVTVDGSGGRACIITCYEIDGADGIGASAINQNSAVSITTTEANSLVIGGVSVRSDGTCTFTPLSGITEVVDASTGSVSSSDINVMNGYALSATPGGLTFGATPSVSTLNINAYVIEILPGAAAPAPTRKCPRHSFWL